MSTSHLLPLTHDLFLDWKKAATIGQNLHERYVQATPFPHIEIDQFLDAELLEKVLSDLAHLPAPEARHDRAQERQKNSYAPDMLPATTRNLFWFFNTRPFLAFLEGLTGIPCLMGDPYYLGGGIHEVRNGGYLNIHADFNIHKLMNVERRINVLIYLNKDWLENYGGQFEIWSKDMKECHKRIIPSFNRCVIFNTSSDSLHGNPEPVAHPHGISRLSIALYYYTASLKEDTTPMRTTQFRVRPGTTDRFDWQVKCREVLVDLTPPIIRRKINNLINRSKQPDAGQRK